MPSASSASPIAVMEMARPGKHRDPPGLPHVLLRVVEHAAPAHDIRIAGADEAQARFEQNRARHLQRGRDDHRGQGIGEDFAKDDPGVARPVGAGRHDERTLSQRQELGAHQPRDLRPRQDSDDEDRAPEVGAEHRDDDEREEEPRHHLEHLGQPHQHIVDPAAVESGDRSDRDPEHDRQNDRQKPDLQRGPRPVEDAAEHIAAQVIGAEQMPGLRRRKPRASKLERPEWRNQRCEQARQDDDRDDHEAHKRQPVLPEPAPAVRPPFAPTARSRLGGDIGWRVMLIVGPGY